MFQKQFKYLLFIILIFAFNMSKAQFKSGNWELSFMGSMGALSSSAKTTSSIETQNKEYSSSHNYFQLSLMPAFFVLNGFSVEPEVSILSMQAASPAISFIFNLDYTFDTYEEFYAPFFRAGYGISNSFLFPLPNGMLNKVSDTFNVKIINAGAGLKFLLSKLVTFRSEINYRRYSYSENLFDGFADTKVEQTQSSFSLLLGFSILL